MFLSVVILGRFTTETHAMALLRQGPTRRHHLHHSPGRSLRDIGQSVTFHATRSTTAGPPRYKATVVLSPMDYGISRRGTTKPVKVILDVTLKRA